MALSKPCAPQGRAGRAQVPVEGLASPHLPAAPCRLPELGSAPQRMLSTGFRAESFPSRVSQSGFLAGPPRCERERAGSSSPCPQRCVCVSSSQPGERLTALRGQVSPRCDSGTDTGDTACLRLPSLGVTNCFSPERMNPGRSLPTHALEMWSWDSFKPWLNSALSLQTVTGTAEHTCCSSPPV